jgi:hypothetical protein
MIPPLAREQSNATPGRPIPGRLATGLAVAVLLGITLAFYHGLWLPGLVLIKRDSYGFYPPLKQYLMERLSAGELPQWFPYESLGRPYIGVTHTGVFHPFTALSFLFSAHDAHRAATLFTCLLAAIGAFMLGRRLNFSRTGALLAGLAFALSGYVVSLTESVLYLYSICLLPLFCFALEKALNDSRGWVVAPAVVWATVFLIGDVQTGYYYGFVALLWTAARARGSRLLACLRLIPICGLVILLAAIQLGPAWAVFIDSERLQPAQFHEQALVWSTHPLRLVTVLASPIGEYADPLQGAGAPYSGLRGRDIGYFWAESLYLGVPVTGLALLGAWQRRDLRVLAILGILALLLSLGQWGGLYEVFYRIVPLWSAFRFPEKFMGLFAFAIAMLAGAGLDIFRTGVGGPWPWITVAVLCGGAGLGFHIDVVSTWTAAILGAPAALARELTDSAAVAFLCNAATALGAGIIVAGLMRRERPHPRLLLGALVMIVSLDLSRANLGAYHTAPGEAATFVPPFAEVLKSREGTLRPGHFRVVPLDESLAVVPEPLIHQLGYYEAVMVARRQALDVLHNAQFHIESPKRYLPGYKAEFIAMVKQKMGTQAAARFNVAYYIGLLSHLKQPQVARGLVATLPEYELALFKNPIPAKPRVYLSRQPEYTSSPVDPMTLLPRTDFLSGEVDVIETTDATLPGPALNGSAAIERYAPEEVRVRVATPRPAVLILLDAFEKGWTATLENGVAVPIMRANALVRAVVVPAGTHVVTFRYETPLLRVGAAVSLLGALLCLGLITHAWWMARANKSVP